MSFALEFLYLCTSFDVPWRIVGKKAHEEIGESLSNKLDQLIAYLSYYETEAHIMSPVVTIVKKELCSRSVSESESESYTPAQFAFDVCWAFCKNRKRAIQIIENFLDAEREPEPLEMLKICKDLVEFEDFEKVGFCRIIPFRVGSYLYSVMKMIYLFSQNTDEAEVETKYCALMEDFWQLVAKLDLHVGGEEIYSKLLLQCW
jgi:hypothetical protein